MKGVACVKGVFPEAITRSNPIEVISSWFAAVVVVLLGSVPIIPDIVIINGWDSRIYLHINSVAVKIGDDVVFYIRGPGGNTNIYPIIRFPTYKFPIYGIVIYLRACIAVYLNTVCYRAITRGNNIVPYIWRCVFYIYGCTIVLKLVSLNIGTTIYNLDSDSVIPNQVFLDIIKFWRACNIFDI